MTSAGRAGSGRHMNLQRSKTMQKNDFTYLSANGKTQIHAIEWIPETEVTAVLQISHGMVEYIARYDDFARLLANAGVYVVGNDHLGHGASVDRDEDHGFFGDPNGNGWVIRDMHRLRCLTEEKYPGKPYFMLGHSMGSFLLRQYLTKYGDGLAGAIIMGTGQQPANVLRLGKMLCRSIAAFKGWHYRSRFINNMAFGSYNKAFEPARTSVDWLTKDESVVDAYLADPWCTFLFTVNAYYQMFSGIERAQNPANIAKIPKDLPILFVSGQDDPVGAQGKGVQQVYDAYEKAGIRELSIKLYPGDRHEILNETDKKQVYGDLLRWFDQQLVNNKRI